MSKLVLLAVLCIFCASISSSPCPLERYVERRDRSFSWSLVNTVAGNLSTTYILNLTSQTWLTAADSNTPVWRHWLAVCVPNTVSYRTALMWIDSGRNTDAAPSTIEPLMQATCDTSNSIVASVGQIPNQPITFSDGVTRVEDDLLGYTWVRFLQNTSKPDWIGRLPMTKAVVKAMDAVEDFVQDQSIRIKNWVISGASKRGWAAWTTAAIDNRVVAIIPVVIPILNMVAVIKNHYQSYGEWSFTFQPYINSGAIAYLNAPEFLELAAIDDPLSYKSDLNMPKYIITTTGDEFFPPDSTKFFFDKLKGENHLRVLPNTEHALIGAESITAAAIKNYYQTILTKEKRPKISWQIVRSNTTASITVRLRDNKVPVQVRLYQSQTLSTTQRDFRLLVCPDPATCWRPVNWIPSVLSPVPSQPKYYTATVSAPAAGWVGFFIEVEYALGAQATQFVISSEVNIVPDRLPFPPCSDCV